MSHPITVGDLPDAWRQEMAEWRAGTRSVHRPGPSGLPVEGASADWHYQNEHQFLRQMELVRDYERNDPVCNSVLTRLTANVCQRGFTLDPQTGSDFDALASERWQEWADNPLACDVQGRLTFNELAATAFRSTVRDGDYFVVPLSSGRLKTYEAHRARTPRNTTRNVVHGVLLDQHQRPQQYWFCDEGLTPFEAFTRVADAVKVDAFDPQGNPAVFHVLRTPRNTQSRGVSWMAPSIDVLEMSATIQFAKMVHQQVVSCYALILERALDHRPEHADGDREAEYKLWKQGIRQSQDSVGPGTLYETLPGDKLSMHSPNVPNAEFFDHAKLLLTFLAMNLSVPVNVLMLDPSDTNFSGWRGAIDQARQEWRVLQQWLSNRLHTPTYRWWLRYMAATDKRFEAAASSLGPAYFRHEWKAPAWQYIEPQKDALADAAILHTGMGPRRRLMANRGISYDEEMPALLAELEWELRQTMLIAARLNEEFKGQNIGAPIDWREAAQARGILPSIAIASLQGSLDPEPAQKTTPKEAA